jgi:hypothetical protein
MCGFSEIGQLGRNNIPNNLVIDAKIIVYKPVAHTGNFLPLDLRLLRTDFVRNFLGGLTDDFQASNNRSLQGLVVQKRFPVQTCGCLRDKINL